MPGIQADAHSGRGLGQRGGMVHAGIVAVENFHPIAPQLTGHPPDQGRIRVPLLMEFRDGYAGRVQLRPQRASSEKTIRSHPMAGGMLSQRQIHGHSLQTAYLKAFNELHDPHGRPATYFRFLLTKLRATNGGSFFHLLLAWIPTQVS